MKLPLVTILNIQPLYNRIQNKRLPIKLMYKLSKFFSSLNNEVSFYQERLSKIIDQYSEKDEHGKPILSSEGIGVKIQKDLIKDCQVALNELLNFEVEIPDTTFTLEELDNLDLSVDEFNMFLPLIEE